MHNNSKNNSFGLQCDEDSGLTLASFFDVLSQFLFPLAVLGANSIEDAKLAAQISQYFHLNMVRILHYIECTYAWIRYTVVVNFRPLDTHITLYLPFIQLSFSPTCLAESIDLPNHFCMLPSKEHLLYSVAGFIEHFGWQRTAVITESGYPFALV